MKSCLKMLVLDAGPMGFRDPVRVAGCHWQRLGDQCAGRAQLEAHCCILLTAGGLKN